MTHKLWRIGFSFKLLHVGTHEMVQVVMLKYKLQYITINFKAKRKQTAVKLTQAKLVTTWCSG